MTTAFCPAPHCQRLRPYTVGEDGMRRCGYCKKELGKEEIMADVPEGAAQAALDPMTQRLTALEADLVGVAKLNLTRFGEVSDRLRQVEDAGQALHRQLDALENRVNGLTAVVAGFKASVPAPPAPVAKKKPARKR